MKRSGSANSVSFIIVYEGETYNAEGFIIGLVGSDLGGDYAGIPVERYDMEELDGGQSRVTVYLSIQFSDAGLTFASIGDPVYEIEWQELNKPLESHQRCGKLKPGRPKIGTGPEAKQRTWEDWQDLEPTDYDASGSSKWSLVEYKGLRERGTDSFNIAFPVVRRTIYYYRAPIGVGVGCFEPESPPGEAGAPSSAGGFDLSYLKGTEKVSREGRLRTLTTEWIGAWVIDSLIY